MWGGDVAQEGGKDETFLWQLEGSAEVSCGRGSGTLSQHCCTLIQAGEQSVSSKTFCLCDCLIIYRFKVERNSGSLGISITTDPMANKSK